MKHHHKQRRDIGPPDDMRASKMPKANEKQKEPHARGNIWKACTEVRKHV